MKDTTIQIDQVGRVVLPKPVRERFHLRGGDSLAVEVKGNVIELRPMQDVGELRRVNGVLVFSAPGSLDDEDFVSRSREERITEVMGSARGSR